MLQSTLLGSIYRGWQAARIFNRRYHFYKDFVQAGSLCFDIGANAGSRTEVFLCLGARVVAIEPQEELVFHLMKQFGSNANFHLVPKAVGAAEGEDTLYIASAHAVSSLIPDWYLHHQRSFQLKATRQVPVTTLDNLIIEFGLPVFAKIDVEGFELEVLRGLSSPIPTLSLEFFLNNLERANSCLAYLAQFGTLQTNYSVGESMQWALPHWVDARQMMQKLEADRDQCNWEYGDIYVRFNA